MTATIETIITFWFDTLSSEQWWKTSPALDEHITRQFGTLHQQAIVGELFLWRNTPEGRLAEIIVLDQFSRNLYRDNAKAFAADPMALALAQEAVRVQTDKALPLIQRAFLYMPYMHSESLLIHEQALILFNQPGLEKNYEAECRHYETLKHFGRYPYRNAALGRIPTKEEITFLTEHPTP